jgi:hypothetical protein
MKLPTRTLTLPQLALIAGTRAALGAGVAFLAADRLTAEQRRAAGWTLFAVGALSTIPLAAEVIFRHDPAAASPPPSPDADADADTSRREQDFTAAALTL